jgi:Periplasmic component of the Tol biopolymer transport system
MTSIRLLLICVLLAASQLPAAAQSNLIQLTDMLKIKQPGSVDVSADGSKVVYTVTSIVPDEKNKWEYNYQTQIWLQQLDGKSQPRQLTTAKEGASAPSLSPDGQTLAFVRVADMKPQIFLLSLSGGGEPVQLTRMTNGAGNPQWSPDWQTHLVLQQLQPARHCERQPAQSRKKTAYLEPRKTGLCRQ